MAGAKRGLGRGLGALFGDDTVEEVIAEEKAEKAAERKTQRAAVKAKTEKNGKKTDKKSDIAEKRKDKKTVMEDQNLNSSENGKMQEKELIQTELEVRVSEIEPNRDQPRKVFDEAQLQELADSVQKYGVLQPLLVQKKGESYEIIAGERRWRAAKLAGLKTVPVVIREYSPQQTMEIALIENVQRENLNPIEEAQAYQRLMQEFSLKQEEIAERVSKNRTTITNTMRLLNLVPEVQTMLVEGRITNGHARALLAVSDPEQQLELAKRVEREKMSVREIEKAVKLLGKEKKEKQKPEVNEAVELAFLDMENRMKTIMGTKVNISRKDRSKGKIEIEYYSEAELERLVEMIESIHTV